MSQQIGAAALAGPCARLPPPNVGGKSQQGGFGAHAKARCLDNFAWVQSPDEKDSRTGARALLRLSRPNHRTTTTTSTHSGPPFFLRSSHHDDAALPPSPPLHLDALSIEEDPDITPASLIPSSGRHKKIERWLPLRRRPVSRRGWLAGEYPPSRRLEVRKPAQLPCSSMRCCTRQPRTHRPLPWSRCTKRPRS